MSQSPIFRPDPFDPDSAAPASLEADAGGKGLSLTDWVNALSEHGGGRLSADLAVDLVLNEIVERARVATAATAAAIALLRGGEIVCRATTGEHAPGLGVPLHTRSGLSGACVQSRQWQRCDDTETDSRVDRELCRKLGVRSILVYPVLRGEELLGVIEIFSSNANAFSQRETQALQGFSEEVAATLERAARIRASEESPSHNQEAATPERAEAVTPAFESSLPAPLAPPPRREFLTNALTLAVIVLALTLGWVIGRTGGQRSVTRTTAREQVAQSGAAPSDVADHPQPVSAASDEGDSQAGLVVYQNDKIVYPRPSARRGGEPSGATAIQSAAELGRLSATSPVRISPDTARQYIALRVEPEYPAEARERGIQGPVVLDTLVGEDGAVQKFAAIRGNLQLAGAAATAVRQWRFRPFLRNGRPQEFRTRITVVFKLAPQP